MISAGEFRNGVTFEHVIFRLKSSCSIRSNETRLE